jgi:RNA polymerase sigma factor (sigma-70 family)
VRVLSHERSPEDPAEFVPWCRGIAKNMLLHHWRSERRAKTIVCDPMIQAVDLAFEEAHADVDQWAERRRMLNECLEKLPLNSRGLLQGHYVEGRPLADLAGADGRSEAAVKMQLMRLRQGLRTCVQARLKEARG